MNLCVPFYFSYKRKFNTVFQEAEAESWQVLRTSRVHMTRDVQFLDYDIYTGEGRWVKYWITTFHSSSGESGTPLCLPAWNNLLGVFLLILRLSPTRTVTSFRSLGAGSTYVWELKCSLTISYSPSPWESQDLVKLPICFSLVGPRVVPCICVYTSLTIKLV